jgi:hypothetical protein
MAKDHDPWAVSTRERPLAQRVLYSHEPLADEMTIHEYGNLERSDDEEPPRVHHSNGSIISVIAAWKWELTGLLVAYLVMGAVVAVLLWYDGKEQPSWPFRINLNSLVAILTAVLRAMAIISVGEGKNPKFLT